MALPVYDHIVMVLMENHGYGQIITPGTLSSNAPYINNTLAAGGALFSNSHGISHPSFPNYLALFCGSTQGTTNDNCPPAGSPYNVSNMGSSLIAAGKTFGAYAESYGGNPTACSIGSPQIYAGRHVPSPWFSGNLSTSTLHAFTAFPTTPAGFATLPTMSFVTPDLSHDMHSFNNLSDAVRVGNGDSWLQNNMDAYAQWALTHNSLFILQFDEDQGTTGNSIPTIFFGQHVVHGVYNENITHYNILSTIETMYGATLSGSAATSPAITDVFTAAPPPVVSSIQLLQRVATGTEGSSFVITASQPSISDAVITTIAGENPVNYNDPVPANSGVVNASSTSIAVPGITTAIAGDILIWYGFSDSPPQGAGTTSVPPNITVPTGFTKGLNQVNSTGVNADNTGVVGGYKTQLLAGASGDQNGSIPTPNINGGLLVGIRANVSSGTILGVNADIQVVFPLTIPEPPDQPVISVSPGVANVAVIAPAGTLSNISGLAIGGLTALITVAAFSGGVNIPFSHESNVLESAWQTMATFSAFEDSEWGIEAQGTGVQAVIQWDTDQLVSSFLPSTWNADGPHPAQLASTWNVSTIVPSQIDFAFNDDIRTSTQKAVAWKYKKLVSASVASTWNQVKRVTAQKVIRYGVGGTTGVKKRITWKTQDIHVSSNQAVAWNVYDIVKPTVAVSWVTGGRSSAKKRCRWKTNFAVVDQKAVAWKVKALVSSNLSTVWNTPNRINSKKRCTWNTQTRVADL